MDGKVVEMPQKEQDEEDPAILSSDSESEISDADDLDYVPRVQSADDLDQGSSNLDHSCRV